VALNKAKNEWEGNAYRMITEKKDPYNCLCFKNMDLGDARFMDQAKKIFLPIFEHQTQCSIQKASLS
jgi:hypothetical protein